MVEFSNLVYFIAISMVLTIAPGPDILFVMTQSMTQSKWAGIATALGLSTGLIVHTTAAALGISAILHQSALAFNILKYAGAIYLIFLAWKAYREGELSLKTDSVQKQGLVTLYQRGILMNLLNPKVSLFFLAFLPQFVAPQSGNIPVQMIVLGILFMLQAILIFTIVSFFSEVFGKRILGKTKVAKNINFVKAGIFALIGLKLALSGK